MHSEIELILNCEVDSCNFQLVCCVQIFVHKQSYLCNGRFLNPHFALDNLQNLNYRIKRP